MLITYYSSNKSGMVIATGKTGRMKKNNHIGNLLPDIMRKRLQLEA